MAWSSDLRKNFFILEQMISFLCCYMEILLLSTEIVCFCSTVWFFLAYFFYNEFIYFIIRGSIQFYLWRNFLNVIFRLILSVLIIIFKKSGVNQHVVLSKEWGEGRFWREIGIGLRKGYFIIFFPANDSFAIVIGFFKI